MNKNITSLGIGLTNRCNLNCPHCYSRPYQQLDLRIKDVYKILKDFPNLKKVNFGTGESILNPNFSKIVRLFKEKNIELALTSNGLSVAILDDATLSLFKEIDISLDFPKADLHDKWRGQEGTFAQAISSIEKCKKLNIPVSIAVALMNINYKYLPEFREILDKYQVYLRINIYKPVHNKKFLLSYKEFWQAIKLLADNFELVNNSEPVLTIITGNKLKGSPCGNSARVHPNMKITGCVYLDSSKISFNKFKQLKKIVPDFCKICKFVSSCKGGCLGRRILLNKIKDPDSYCPFVQAKSLPKIKFRKSKDREFIHSQYLCTIILR